MIKSLIEVSDNTDIKEQGRYMVFVPSDRTIIMSMPDAQREEMERVYSIVQSKFPQDREAKMTKTLRTPISAEPKLYFQGRYTNLTVIYSDAQEMRAEAEVICRGGKQKNVDEALGSVYIDLKKTGNTVYLSSGINGSLGNNTSVTIDIQLFLPADTRIELDSKYGNVRLPSLDRDLRCDLSYGNLSTENLTGSTNIVSVKYGSISMENTPRLDLTLSYGKLTAGDIGELKVNSRYSTLRVDNLNVIDISSQYDNLQLRKLDRLSATTAHSTIRIDELTGSIDIADLKYGGLEISKTYPEFSKINITSSYSNIKIGLMPECNFLFELSARYGSINIKDIELSESRISSTNNRHTYHEGRVGASTPSGGNITINVSYGNIIFKKY